jgi:hypothetical protein
VTHPFFSAELEFVRHKQLMITDPSDHRVYCNIAVYLRILDQLERSESFIVKALQLKKKDASIYLNYGVILFDQEKLELAYFYTFRGLILQPDHHKFYYNLGLFFQSKNRLSLSKFYYQRTLHIHPTDVDTYYSLAMIALKEGNLIDGFLLSEWRWKMPIFAKKKERFLSPQWQGEKGTHGILILFGEQGFGDVLQFCRFAPMAAERQWRIIIAVHKPLIALLKSLPQIEQVIDFDDVIPPHEAHSSLLSLPSIFQITLETIPSSVPYLSLSHHKDKNLNESLIEGIKIGLCWQGHQQRPSPDQKKIDRLRFIDFEQLTPLWDIDHIHYFSLQKDYHHDNISYPIITVMDLMDDFADTASLIEQLDLIISVDTAIVHLAGALGKPVWLLEPFSGSWRWLLDRDDSPWYPTLRIFRQKMTGHWTDVIMTIKQELLFFIHEIENNK